MATRIQLRRDIASEWTSNNPVLASAEIGVETDTNKFKIGDGSTSWNSLDYASGGIDGAVAPVTYDEETQTVALNYGDGLTASSGTLTVSFGTTSTSVTAGNDSRLSDARTPTGTAGGDLSGTYPNPTIGTGKVTSAHILDGTIVDGDISGTASITASKINGTAVVQSEVDTANTPSKIVKRDAGGTIAVTAVSATGTVSGSLLSSSGTVSGSVLSASGSIVTTTGTISGASLISTGSISTTTGTISGALLNSTGNVTATGNITTSAGSIATTTGTVSGAHISSSGSVVATGTISGARLISTGSISTSTGTISGAHVTSSGSVVATGTVSGAAIVSTGAISTSTGTVSGAVLSSGGSIVTATGTISAAAGTISGSLGVGVNITTGTVTAALVGNATTATTLATARTINGVSFNGSADITVESSITSLIKWGMV